MNPWAASSSRINGWTESMKRIRFNLRIWFTGINDLNFSGLKAGEKG